MSLIVIRSMISSDVSNEIVNTALSGSQGTHESIHNRFNELVTTPTAHLRPAHKKVVHPCKDRICFHWEYNFHVRLLQAFSKLACHAISMPGVSHPRIPCQQSQPLRSQEAHL